MTATSFTQILNNASPLQLAGRTYRQYTFHIPSTSFALRAETALTPQYALANNPFGKVIGRLYSLVSHKCPKIFLVFKNLTAFTTQLAVEACTIFQQRLNMLLKFGHSALKCFPLQCSIANSFSQLQYILCQTIKFIAYPAKFTFGFADSLKISFQVSPAYLANQLRSETCLNNIRRRACPEIAFSPEHSRRGSRTGGFQFV